MQCPLRPVDGRPVSALHDVEDEVELLLHVGHAGLDGGLVLLDVIHVVPHRLQRGLAVLLVVLRLITNRHFKL